MRSPGSLSSLFYPLRKRWYLVLICMLIACVAATRYLYMATPEYQASATIKIEDPQGVANSNLYRDFDVFKTNMKVQTELEVLKSRNLFGKALENLDFFVEYYNGDELHPREIYRDAPISVDFKITDSSFYSQEFDFTYINGDKFKIRYDVNGVEREKSGVFGEQICDRGVCITINKDDRIVRYKTIQYLQRPWNFIVYSKQALTEKLMTKDYLVKALDKDINIIKVYYTHPIPEKASRLVNAIADAYIQQGIEDKKGFAGSTVDFINQQLTIVSRELEAARDELKSYRISNEIVNIPQETEATYKNLSQLEMQKIDIGMQISVLENMSDYLRRNQEIKLSGPEYGTVMDELFQAAVAKLNARIHERDELLLKYTAENDRVIMINEEITQLKNYLVESINNTRRKLFTRQDEIYFAIDEQRSTFKGVPEKESTLQELNRNYMLYEKVYNFLIEKRTEAIITRQVNVSFNKVLEAAIVPMTAVAPQKEVVWGVSLFLGLVIGIALAYIRHFMNPSVNAPEDIYADSNIGVIGQIPKLKKDEPAYEPFTALSTRILMNLPSDKPAVITVTSTRRGEGKSFIATNLARSFAAMDKKVLLVDLNTYQPRIAAWFDARSSAGMKEIYSKHTPVQDVIQLTSIPNLDIITAGDDSSPIGHLLATSRTRELIDELKLHYDTVIFDTPEVGEHVDAVNFMRWSDLNLYVVKADTGKIELISNAEMVKEEYRLNEVHFVLNGMKEKRTHTGYLRPKKLQVGRKKSGAQLTNLFAW